MNHKTLLIFIKLNFSNNRENFGKCKGKVFKAKDLLGW